MHIDWWVLLAAGIAMVFLLLVWMTVALPSLRLRQAGKHLRRIMEHPEEETMTPRALRSIGGELADLRLQLERQDGELREQERRRQELIAFLAHDLKTPLTSVIGYLTLLRDEPDLSPALRARYTGVALEKAERLEDLINEFFDITRFNLTHLELERSPVDLIRMLQQVGDARGVGNLPALAGQHLHAELHHQGDQPVGAGGGLGGHGLQGGGDGSHAAGLGDGAVNIQENNPLFHRRLPKSLS